MKSKGWIALDIDGTITLDSHSIPKPVVACLRQLQGNGWRIAIATGRHLGFSKKVLSQFNFPYLLLPQNGSGALEMPEEKVIFKHFLPASAIGHLEEACKGSGTHFLIYMGFDREDLCYFCPSKFSQKDLLAIEHWKERQKGNWEAVEEFCEQRMKHFALAKCFGPLDRMQAIANKLPEDQFQVACIRDPFKGQDALLLISDAKASKGLGMEELFRRFGRGDLVIAAGDDENDESLLKAADVRIAMPHAPKRLLEIATLIAPPTKDQGIIEALKKATGNGERNS